MTSAMDGMKEVQPYESNLAIIVGNGKVLHMTHR